jgi:hypothetical protein
MKVVTVVGVRVEDLCCQRHIAHELGILAAVVEEELAELGGNEHVRNHDSQLSEPLAQHEPVAVGVKIVVGVQERLTVRAEGLEGIERDSMAVSVSDHKGDVTVSPRLVRNMTGQRPPVACREVADERD